MYGRNVRHMRVQSKLSTFGHAVEVRIVAEHLSESEAFASESRLIKFWRDTGTDLVNLTDGGEGVSNPSPETRARMRAAKVGRRLTDQHKEKVLKMLLSVHADPVLYAKMRAASAAGQRTPEARAKRSAASKALVRTEQHCARISASKTGLKCSPEHAAKNRVASLGRKQPQEEIERRRIGLIAAWKRRKDSMHSRKEK